MQTAMDVQRISHRIRCLKVLFKEKKYYYYYHTFKNNRMIIRARCDIQEQQTQRTSASTASTPSL